MDKRVLNNIKGAIGPYDNHCSSFLNPSGPQTPNYVNVCKLSIGKIKLNSTTKKWDDTTKMILAYDRAETNDAYLGQLNVIAASSFISPFGVLWGYDIAKTNLGKSLFTIDKIPVYSILPLLDAGQRLFGNTNVSEKYYGETYNPEVHGIRFPVKAGEIQPCAVKSASMTGPGVIWCAMGIGIPEERLAHESARLFYEDAGSYKTKTKTNPTSIFIKSTKNKLDEKIKNIATAMILNGKDQNPRKTFSKIIIGYRMLPLNSNEIGESITLSPYIRLAKNAVPNKQPEKLLNMNIDEWEKNMKKNNYKQKITSG